MFSVLTVVTNPVKQHIQPEVTGIFMHNALRFSYCFSHHDLYQSFNYWDFDGLPRTRIVSTFLQIFNYKLRLILFDHIVPLPSFTIVWMFLLCILPYCLFKISLSMDQNKLTAYVIIGMIFTSSGFLSLLSLMFHPGKPVAFFFTALCLFLISKPEKTINFLFFLSILLIGFFTDEQAWFLALFFPLSFPSLFFSPFTEYYPWQFFKKIKTLHPKRTVSYIIIVVLMGVFAIWGLPVIAAHMGILDFNLVDTIKQARQKFHLSVFFKNFHINTLQLIGEHIFPQMNSFISIFGYRTVFVLKNIFIVSVLGAVLFQIKYLNALLKKKIVSYLLMLFFYIVFSTVVFYNYGGTVHNYYYGSLASLFFVIPFGLLLMSRQPPWFWRILNKFIILIIMFAGYYNFTYTNSVNINADRNVFYYKEYADVKFMQPSRRLSRKNIEAVWKTRKTGEFKTQQKEYPANQAWLFHELSAVYNKYHKYNILRIKPHIPGNADKPTLAIDYDRRTAFEINSYLYVPEIIFSADQKYQLSKIHLVLAAAKPFGFYAKIGDQWKLLPVKLDYDLHSRKTIIWPFNSSPVEHEISLETPNIQEWKLKFSKNDQIKIYDIYFVARIGK